MTTAAGPPVKEKTQYAPNKRWLDHAAYQAQGYMPALDGLRGVAIALVITCHLHERLWTFVSGHVGVTIFFVLSGYLITRLALQEERRFGHLNLTAFYIRRTFRIFPVYYVVLGIYTLMILGLRTMPDKIVPFHGALPYYLTYLQEFPYWRLVSVSDGTLPFYQSWSLGIEEKFYLIWPLLMILTRHSGNLLRLMIVGVSALLLDVYGIISEHLRVYHTQHFAFILLGVLLALLLSDAKSYNGFLKIARRLGPVALIVALGTQFYLMPHTALVGLTSIYAFMMAVLIGLVAASCGTPVRLLSNPALVLIGKVSYSIYLLHILCLNVVEHVMKPGRGVVVGVAAYFLALLISTGAAYLSYRTFEKPLINIGRRLAEALSSGPVVEARVIL